MYKIYKVVANPVVDFAAEELKKYLRMMMPRCGEISIVYDPEAKTDFRLGLMENFGLDTSEAEDLVLDDILHIDTTCEGGIIAGSNARSVLLAVYRYLTLNGCRWLYPGVDGEFIPVKNVEAISYHKMADCRFRGQCNEGAEYQSNMMEAIDWTPKVGMNVFMLEFDNPKVYYDFYYNHEKNSTNREPEPITPEITLQWKRQCEVEMCKRGLQFHDMGHGWTAESFGISSTDGWKATDNEADAVPDESREFLAMVNGKRELWGGIALNTEFCMSNPRAREKFANRVAEYAKMHQNVDYLHVWLSDGAYNQCECENCAQKTPSDWYVILLNEIDEALTRENLDTRVVFIAYHETAWAPLKETIKHHRRFSFMLAAISRNYVQSVSPVPQEVELKPYQLNVKGSFPTTVEEFLAHADVWKAANKCPSLLYEYHFWFHEYHDLGTLKYGKLIYDDVRGYKARGYNGIIEDGSQRSFFPNGFCFFVYASTLFDTSVKYEDLVEDYYSHAYGDIWQEVVSLMQRLGDAADMNYLMGFGSSDPAIGQYYNPKHAVSLRTIVGIADELEALMNANKNKPYRVQTVSVRLLRRYAEYCRLVSKVLVLKAVGADEEAYRAYEAFLEDFGRYEVEIERYYDQFNAGKAFKQIVKVPTNL